MLLPRVAVSLNNANLQIRRSREVVLKLERDDAGKSRQELGFKVHALEGARRNLAHWMDVAASACAVLTNTPSVRHAKKRD